jgi:DnaK suppressor protein
MDAGSDRLTPAQLSQLRAALEAKRDELRRVIAARMRATAEGDDELTEEGDAATREISITEDDGVAAVDRRLLGDVERALAKMEAGTYGASEASGDPIPFERLKAIPWARNDADEEETLERR